MINKNDLQKIGNFRKPHGIRGEITMSFTSDCFDESDCPFLICETDGMLIPFRLEEYRFTSDNSAIVKLNDIDSSEKVAFLSNCNVYFPKKYINNKESDDFSPANCIGFTLIDVNHGLIGQIADVDESTRNTLFIVENNTREILIPANDAFLEKINFETEEILIKIPDGLLEI